MPEKPSTVPETITRKRRVFSVYLIMHEEMHSIQVLRLTLGISARRKQRQEDGCKFKPSLVFIASTRPGWAT